MQTPHCLWMCTLFTQSKYSKIYNTQLCYGRYSLCMCWHLFSCIYRLNYLLYASQEYGHAPLCMQLCNFILRLQLNAWLSAYAFMCSVNIPPTKWFITNITHVRTSTMCALTYLHITFVSECFISHITGKWMLSIMCAQMRLHITQITECFFTHITRIWMLSIMCVLMCHHVTLVTECFVTYITTIWLLSTLCALVCLIITLITKCFITLNTGIWTLSTMYALYTSISRLFLNVLLCCWQQCHLSL
jgi:hypothetical protein